MNFKLGVAVAQEVERFFDFSEGLITIDTKFSCKQARACGFTQKLIY